MTKHNLNPYPTNINPNFSHFCRNNTPFAIGNKHTAKDVKF